MLLCLILLLRQAPWLLLRCVEAHATQNSHKFIVTFLSVSELTWTCKLQIPFAQHTSCSGVCLISGLQYRLQKMLKDSRAQKPESSTKSVPSTKPQQNLTASSSVAAVQVLSCRFSTKFGTIFTGRGFTPTCLHLILRICIPLSLAI